LITPPLSNPNHPDNPYNPNRPENIGLISDKLRKSFKDQLLQTYQELRFDVHTYTYLYLYTYIYKL